MPASTKTQAAESDVAGDIKTPPIYKTRSRAVHGAVWVNEVVGKDGQKLIFHTVKLERNYPDESKENGWGQTSQLRDRDLGDAIAVLQNIQQRLMAT